jgi:hypothetical protein
MIGIGLPKAFVKSQDKRACSNRLLRDFGGASEIMDALLTKLPKKVGAMSGCL